MTKPHVFNQNSEWAARGYILRSPPLCIVVYDPAGDGDDFDALVVGLREEHQRGEPHDPDFAVETKYRILISERMPVDYEFPDKVARVLAMHRTLKTWEAEGKIHTHLIAIETNGVGWGLASSIKDKIGEQVIPYTTVGSSGETPYTGAKCSMPRLAALDHLRILMETFHVRMIPEAPGVKNLMQELNAFVWKRPGRPEALNGANDDLVMALCGLTWIGSKIVGPILRAETPRGRMN